MTAEDDTQDLGPKLGPEDFPRRLRPRRPSGIQARDTSLEIIDARIRSLVGWEAIAPSAQNVIRQLIGEAYDAGERRGEVRRQDLEDELIGVRGDAHRLSGVVAELKLVLKRSKL